MTGRSVALLPWGDLVEDFLDPLGLTIADYAGQMTGGWLFGYVEALASADVRTVIVCVSATVQRPERHEHLGTGAPIWVLPASRSYLLARRQLATPYAWHRGGAAGNRTGAAALASRVARHVAPYLSTPLGPLARVLRDEHCQAILCQEYEEARYDAVALLGRRLRLPVSASFQGGTAARTGVERVVRTRTLRLARSLVVGSQVEAERLRTERSVPAHRIARIPNPLNLHEWRPGDRTAARRGLGLPESARVVVWHGRVEVHRKGLDVLLDAWRGVTDSRPAQDLVLLMVGTGTDAPALRARLAEQPLPGVRWLDRYTLDRDELRTHLHAADVAVLPSRLEGFAVAPLEAMACGLPVVVTDVAGVRDLLPAGEQDGGLIVPVGDAAALGSALGSLLDDLPRARRVGLRARARTQEAYSLVVVGQRLRAAVLPASTPPGS